MNMPPAKPDIDINRRHFIQASLVIVGTLVIGKVSGLFSWISKGAPTASVPSLDLTANTGSAAALSSQRTLPAGAKEYRNTAYHFSLLYPQELAVDERAEGGGASTITFQNVEKGEGFQVFIVPYGEAKVSEERFKQDIPSGVRKSLSNITVDGATAAAFYSTNAALGDTREVWIVHGGYLYEITTLKPLDSWLDSIVETWRFM